MHAGVAKLADAQDLKSWDRKRSCGFDPRPRHQPSARQATDMWSTDSRWFDIAAFSTLWVVLTVVFGRFEQHKPAWRRLSKWAVFLVLLVGLIETAGRPVAYGVLGLLIIVGASFHFALLSKLGINGWTGEPRDRFDALVRELEVHGERRTILRLARDLLWRSH